MTVEENQQQCSPCASNTYSTGTAAECTQCGDNMFSLQRATSFDYCYCLPGFGSPGALDTDLCEPCPNATFWTGSQVQRQVCTTCPHKKTSAVGSSLPEHCHCLPGHGVPSNSQEETPCSECRSGTFAYGGSNQPCESCGWGTVTEPALAAQDKESCMCNAEMGLFEL